MVKKILLGAIVCVCIVLAGCSKKQIGYSVDVLAINADYNLLVERYDMLRPLVISKWDSFTVEEQFKIRTINENVERIIYKVDAFRSVSFYEITPAEMGYIYTLGKQSYEMAKEIYLAHESKLTPLEGMTFKMFDEKLLAVDKRVLDLMTNPDKADISSTLVDILLIVSTGIKIILPLVVL